MLLELYVGNCWHTAYTYVRSANGVTASSSVTITSIKYYKWYIRRLNKQNFTLQWIL